VDVLLDADVLGRQRTGDETYVASLLAELAQLEHGLALGAVTRRPDLVPPPIRALRLDARSQTLRMAYRLPRLLRRLGPRLAHFQHAVPLAARVPAVVTIHDLSFERDPHLMGLRDRLVFKAAVPRSVRRATRVIAVSEATKRDLVELYGVPEGKVTVIPNGVDAAFHPNGASVERPPYALFVGALHRRKDPLAAVEALALVGGDLRLVVVGPDKGLGAKTHQRAAELGVGERVHLAGHVAKQELAELYRGAACLVFPSRYEGFGLPVLEAMASGVPVVATSAGSVPEIAGDAAILVQPGRPAELAGGIERALADRDRLVEAGLARARSYSWRETASRTLDLYRELL
jgi:glycosyltransferase involved in cell wall biosynthesis